MSSEATLRRQGGLTLIELIIFIVVIGIALVAVLRVLSFTTAHSADPLRRKQALMIAEGLLEEVQQARFTWCDPSSDNARDDTVTGPAACTIPEAFGQAGTEPAGERPFDNVNDYVSAPNVATRAFDVDGTLRDANGDPMGVDGYTAQVTIVPEALHDIAVAGTAAEADVLRIRIEVSFDDQTLVLDGYRTRYAPQFL
jgi:MSHA pilin protein MshD